MRKAYLLTLVSVFLALPHAAQPETVKGIYGIPSVGKVDPDRYLSLLREAEANAVFVPAEEETVAWFSARGFRVYLSVNTFGGKTAWEKYPDSRPLEADGSLLGSNAGYRGYGGVCPSHNGWRQDRLEHIEEVLRRFSGRGLSGIWLDHIRYPGYWGTQTPAIPDTCYHPRCLGQFQADMGFGMPEAIDINDTPAAARWIRENRLHEWVMWKKSEIHSFVADVLGIVDRIPEELRPILGLFLVPWTKGEKGNAISHQLAQDAFQLSELVDVISPMVYHGMVGRDEDWVGYMARYYAETAHSRVWPIVQAKGTGKASFERVLSSAGKGGADGVLVFSYHGLVREHWKRFAAFQAPVNLIQNPGFQVVAGEDTPEGWHTGKNGGKSSHVHGSIFTVKSSQAFDLREGHGSPGRPFDFLGIFAGNDRSGFWYSPLPRGDAGEEYLFTGLLYRDTWANGLYPSIRLWGEAFYINNHWFAETFQPIRLHVRYPGESADHAFYFINHNGGRSFWLAKPRLVPYRPFRWEGREAPEADRSPALFEDAFPIGAYGVDLPSLSAVKALSLNTVLIAGQGEDLRKKIRRSQALGLKTVLSVPRDPDRLQIYLEEIASYVRPADTAFYVNDEPGIRSFPINRAEDIDRLIKGKFPESKTAMAVVRPQVVKDYLQASDFFMMDQYPVPYMPMTWLSDSMDRAAQDAGRNRLASVIQAFGGPKHGAAGWPRLPTWQEMDCLSFLSIVHGSRGIFFYTFAEIGQTDEGLSRLGRVVERLNRVYPWLLIENIDVMPEVMMVSDHRVSPTGQPAIHTCIKKKEDRILVIAVNTIGTYVEGEIRLGGLRAKGVDARKIRDAKDIFSETYYPVIDGGLRAKFQPYETRVFLMELQ